jgi:hypothetical protein
VVGDYLMSATPFQQNGPPTLYTAPPLCTISGPVLRADGTAAAYATATFNSHLVQVINGNAIQPFIVSSSTDINGMLQAINLVQGLMLAVKVSDGGVTYPANTAMVPMTATANFSDLFSWG